jgi:hypothetical protein
MNKKSWMNEKSCRICIHCHVCRIYIKIFLEIFRKDEMLRDTLKANAMKIIFIQIANGCKGFKEMEFK